MPTIERDPDQIDGPVSSGCEEGLSLLPAQRLMAAHVALVAAAAVMYLTVPAARAFDVGRDRFRARASVALTGVPPHRPAQAWPWWVYPVQPLSELQGLTWQQGITALDSDDDTDRRNPVLTRLAARFPLRSGSRAGRAAKR
ncbi:hypothetical protein [Streptomyces sp.]|uniref:hypothetical protein n=1 Tax=Streptomyces sp. TaxID=1931 RepID=UPI002D69BCB1|nr:hypothetical protein [Streptomyces sp.]HZF92366.1 hypothetical protein [Streptomyces sp.]